MTDTEAKQRDALLARNSELVLQVRDLKRLCTIEKLWQIRDDLRIALVNFYPVHIEGAVGEWVATRLGPQHTTSKERAMRLLEESIELAQAEGIEMELALKQLMHVYSRPAGNPMEEAAGAAICLYGWCEANGVRVSDLASKELERIESLPDEKIQSSLKRKAEAGLLTCDL